MKFLNKVMTYFGMVQSKNFQESQNFAGEVSVALSLDRTQGAKVAAIAAALHHHEMENSQNGGSLGIAALVAVIHHHNNLKK
jgi:Na+-transporting methylmalonyl-CoA/oxaloacetate decarboxylase gamma subunit